LTVLQRTPVLQSCSTAPGVKSPKDPRCIG
jgi:hypothetical protein